MHHAHDQIILTLMLNHFPEMSPLWPCLYCRAWSIKCRQGSKTNESNCRFWKKLDIWMACRQSQIGLIWPETTVSLQVNLPTPVGAVQIQILFIHDILQHRPLFFASFEAPEVAGVELIPLCFACTLSTFSLFACPLLSSLLWPSATFLPSST